MRRSIGSRNQRDPDKPFFVCHHYKAPHDYFESNPRYDSYLADVDIPEPESLWSKPDTWGSIATRGHEDELDPHIGTSIGRAILVDRTLLTCPRNFPTNSSGITRIPNLRTTKSNDLAYQAYLKKYLLRQRRRRQSETIVRLS